MLLNTFEITITPRASTAAYNVQLSDMSIAILGLIFEFKLATAWQITRFLKQRDRMNYMYLKLHRMWQAGFLESFKVYTGSRAGMPVYYMLAKHGLSALAERASYDAARLKQYPSAKSFLSSGLFKHEAQVVELASKESMNRSQNFEITFKGEDTSVGREYRSDKNIEVLTPDYTVYYIVGGHTERIYTEFERTNKTNQAMIKKIERYITFLNPDETKHTTLRIIFQTAGMEASFWLMMVVNKPTFLQKLRVRTTHSALLTSPEHFLEPIYASEKTVQLEKNGRLSAHISERIKLFSFL